jgi:hypothetical protein
MKPFVFVTLVIALVSSPTLPAQAETKPQPLGEEEIGDLFVEAVMLASVGQYDEAEQRCQRLLAQKPNDPTVKKLLEGIRSKREKNDASAELRRQLTEMIVPEVNFRQADAIEAVHFLRDQSKKLSKDKRAVNIVWLIPTDAKLAPVTLHLEKVPLLEAIRYVAQAAGASIRIEPHAVVIAKTEQETEAPPTTAQRH